MEKSELREAPYEVGRARVFEKMNTHAGPFTHVCRLVNPEGARMTLHYVPGARVEAWHQSGGELAALYSWNDSWILFDRFNGHEGLDTVVVISALTFELQLSAGALILATQSTLDDVWTPAIADD